MSYINSLDTSELSDFPRFSEANGKGTRVNDAIRAYIDQLTSVSNNGFEANDTSTVHGVVDALNFQMQIIESMLVQADVLLDDALRSIQEDIVDRENQLSCSITEV